MENTTSRSTIKNATSIYVRDSDVISDPCGLPNTIDEGTRIIPCVGNSTGHEPLVDFSTTTNGMFASSLLIIGSDGHGDAPEIENIAVPTPVYPHVPGSSVRTLESHLSPFTCQKQVNNENVLVSRISIPPRSRTPPPCPPPPPPSPVGHIDDITHLVQPPPPQIGGSFENAAWRKVAARLRAAYNRFRAPCSRVFTALINGRDYHTVQIEVYVTCERFMTFECQRD